MKAKRVKCSECGTRNWPGREYCEKCSGELFYNQQEKNEKAKLDKAV